MINVIINDYLKPVGGPSGYLYNLYLSLEDNNYKDKIRILSNGLSATEYQKKLERKTSKVEVFVKKIKIVLEPTFMRLKKIRQSSLKQYSQFYNKFEKELLESSINHFHTTKDLYYFRCLYPHYRGICILTSHSPQPPYLEVFGNLIGQNYPLAKASKISKLQEKIDIEAFKFADYIIWPCEEAIEPYESFLSKHSIKNDKFMYVITASKELTFMKTSNDFRDKYNIPSHVKVFSYIGRKNEIKGFDIFCQIAQTMKKNQNVIFLSAGIGPIETPQQENFIDIGWTNDPGSVVNASDFVIVPNRETYFDLNVIQVMSLGKPIITTFTGGNRWFVNKNVDFIFFDINNINDLIKKLDTLENSGKKNQIFFYKHLDYNLFAQNYYQTYNKIELLVK